MTFSSAASAVLYKGHSGLDEENHMSIECFEVSFDKELQFILADIDQMLRDQSLLIESVYHSRISEWIL